MNDMTEKTKTNVVEPDPHEFPYGAKITIFLNGEIQFDIEDKLYELKENLTLKFVNNDTTHSQFTEITYSGFQVWDVLLAGFKTACEAELAGIKLAESFLWLSVSRNFPVRLIYNKALPCTVYDRTKGPGIVVSGFGHQTRKEKSEDVIKGVKDAFFSDNKVKIDRNRMLLAMEIFSASQLEITERAKYISLITSLEALSERKNYKEYTELVQDKVNDLIKAIKEDENIPMKIRSSLEGKIKREMSIESVRQAILRIVKKEDKKLFEKAYDVRSSLVHDGKTNENLQELTKNVSQLIRNIFSSSLGLKLNDS